MSYHRYACGHREFYSDGDGRVITRQIKCKLCRSDDELLKQKLGTNPKDLLGTNKVPLSRIPPVAIMHLGMAMGNGGDKYGPYNWRGNSVQADIYVDAALRHILTWFDRQTNAEDSGVHHLGHAMACLAILLDAEATGNLIDNRPSGGKAAEVLEQLNQTRKIARDKAKEASRG